MSKRNMITTIMLLHDCEKHLKGRMKNQTMLTQNLFHVLSPLNSSHSNRSFSFFCCQQLSKMQLDVVSQNNWIHCNISVSIKRQCFVPFHKILYSFKCNPFFVFQVKVWFQNYRYKYKRQVKEKSMTGNSPCSQVNETLFNLRYFCIFR